MELYEIAIDEGQLLLSATLLEVFMKLRIEEAVRVMGAFEYETMLRLASPSQEVVLHAIAKQIVENTAN